MRVSGGFALIIAALCGLSSAFVGYDAYKHARLYKEKLFLRGPRTLSEVEKLLEGDKEALEKEKTNAWRAGIAAAVMGTIGWLMVRAGSGSKVAVPPPEIPKESPPTDGGDKFFEILFGRWWASLPAGGLLLALAAGLYFAEAKPGTELQQEFDSMKKVILCGFLALMGLFFCAVGIGSIFSSPFDEPATGANADPKPPPDR